MAIRLQQALTCSVVLSVLLAHGGAAADWLFVAPGGSDGAAGRSTRAPLATVQKALELARPGDTVALMPGTYRQDIESVRDGEAGAAIRIQGTPDAVVKGAGDTYVIEIRHDHIELAGFTVDGHFGEAQSVDAYREKLVYVHGDGDGVTGVRVRGMTLRHALGECLRLKSGARGNEVANSAISHCGLRDFRFDRGRKIGEAVYIGTAPEQREGERDVSTGNHIHHNVLRPHGSECVDIKEGSTDNLVEHNVCLDQVDPDSGGISVRGNGNTIRHNVVGPTKGAGIRLGGDGESDGIRNRVYGNQLQYNEAGALKVMRLPQAALCGNDMRQPAGWPDVRFAAGRTTPVPDACPDDLANAGP